MRIANIAPRSIALVDRLPRRLREATLGTKLVAILTMIGLIGFLGTLIVLGSIITPSFDGIETKAVNAHIERTKATLEEYASKVEIAVKDYGVWDDSYKYMNEPTEQFETAVFSVLAYTNLDINGMAYVGWDHRIHRSRWVDLERQDYDAGLAQAFERLIRSSRVMNMARDTESAHFYARVGDKVVAVGIAKVFRSDGSGTSPGFVVMARQISSTQLSRLIQVDAKLSISPVPSIAIVTELPDRLDIAVDIAGIDKARVATAEFSVPRDVSRLGQRTLMIAVLGSAIILAFTLFILRQLIGQLVISPLNRVERHMQEVSGTGSLEPLSELDRQDEIGSLVHSFNTMLAQLKDLREQVEIQSFKLGRSESAVGVMHNVRNGLNPISVIISQGIAEQPVIGQNDVIRALSELAAGGVAEVRRQKLVAFLSAAIEMQKTQIERRRDELVTAKDCLSGVIEIIGDQQELAHEQIETAPCDVRQVIEQNAALARYSAKGRIDFTMFDGSALVLANRILLSQVVGNLFSNAVEAISAAAINSGRISVMLRRKTIDGRRAIIISITDNGEGFTPGTEAQLFQRGFSTRRQKAGGLGLHWCANSINAMRGALQLTSAGPGTGATATITLPAAEADAAEGEGDLRYPESSIAA